MSRHPLAAGLVTVSVFVAAGCGDGGSATKEPPSSDCGRRLFAQRGCPSCHTTNGERGVGPTLAGLAGSVVKLGDGRTLTADSLYLRRSILDPDADVVEGFAEGVMAGAMPAPLTEEEADAVVAYLQDL